MAVLAVARMARVMHKMCVFVQVWIHKLDEVFKILGKLLQVLSCQLLNWCRCLREQSYRR